MPSDNSSGGGHRNVEAHGGGGLELNLLEKLCLWGSMLCIVMMLVTIAIDVIGRSGFNSSYFGHSDELGGYLLVGIGFLSLSVGQVRDTYHRVEFVLQRLSRWQRSAMLVVFDLMSLAFAAVLLWQTIRLEIISWETSETALTVLETPLWLPRLFMPIGALVLCLSLIRTAWSHGRDAVAAFSAKEH